jgi:hypothetical protein
MASQPWSNISPRALAIPVLLACLPSIASMPDLSEMYLYLTNRPLTLIREESKGPGKIHPLREVSPCVRHVKSEQSADIDKDEAESEKSDLRGLAILHPFHLCGPHKPSKAPHSQCSARASWGSK